MHVQAGIGISANELTTSVGTFDCSGNRVGKIDRSEDAMVIEKAMG
jgi:hypothetical protein